MEAPVTKPRHPSCAASKSTTALHPVVISSLLNGRQRQNTLIFPGNFKAAHTIFYIFKLIKIIVPLQYYAAKRQTISQSITAILSQKKKHTFGLLNLIKKLLSFSLLFIVFHFKIFTLRNCTNVM